MVFKNKRREGANWSQMRPHDEFLELCAVSTTGELSDDERKQLHEHLATCAECREALKEFEAAADVGAPLLSSALGAHEASELSVETGEGIRPSADGMPARVQTSASRRDLAEQSNAFVFAQRNGRRRTEINWNYVWVPFAAAIVLAITLGIYAYHMGETRSVQVRDTAPAASGPKIDALEQQLSDASHEGELLRAQLANQDRTILKLKHEIARQSADLSSARNAQTNLEHSLQDALSAKQQIAQQASTAGQDLANSQEKLRDLQAKLTTLQKRRNQDELSAQSFEDQIKDLNAQLGRSRETVNKQQDLLADDRDIRDLMGARDLYIAEVYDVARDGATKKPYGRVFYTKGKSLIFYAYDLDQQPGVKETSTFQAWGQDGPERQEALSLGIFYQDSVSKKRWVLKFDDPHALEQINAVFVTVEPHGGSQKPSGRPLLFASLRIEPNHP